MRHSLLKTKASRDFIQLFWRLKNRVFFSSDYTVVGDYAGQVNEPILYRKPIIHFPQLNNVNLSLLIKG